MTVIMFLANILIFRKMASISKILFLALLCLLPAYTVIPVVQFALCSTFITLYEYYDCLGMPSASNGSWPFSIIFPKTPKPLYTEKEVTID